MQRSTLISICALLVSLTGFGVSAATPINHGMSGLWYNPATDGQGFAFEIVPQTRQLVAHWYTYASADGKQQWLFADGSYVDDVATLNFVAGSGGRFNAATPPDLPAWGKATLRFDSCTSATLEFQSIAGAAGVIQLQRLTPDEWCQSYLNSDLGLSE